MSTIVNLLDKHRFLLVLFLLGIISLIFSAISFYIFINYKFTALECDNLKSNNTCLASNKEIFTNPRVSIENLFKEYNNEINILKKDYNLPDFNNYTAYYYYLASIHDYELNGRNETLMHNFKIYVDTYDLISFYENNNIYYEMFYPYKLV